MRETTERVTVKMIAEKAHTSIGTVDRALNNRGGISEKSKRLVLSVAKELGYEPNKFASALGRKKSFRIGMAYPLEPRGFYQYIDMGIDKAAAELLDYGVTVEKIRYQSQDPVLQHRRLEELNPASYDALAINSAGAGIDEQIERFCQLGLPVITFNTDAPTSNRLFYIGDNSRQSGQIGGELLSLLLRGKGNVTVLGNFARTTPFVERLGGFCEYVQLQCPEIHIYPCSECQSKAELATQSLTELLRRQPDINGVFCTGYSSTVGAIQALKALDRRDIYLVGFDVGEGTDDAVREGWCSALLYQDPYQQGYQTATQLAQYLLEGRIPSRQQAHIHTHIVLRSNLNDYSLKALSKI